MATVLIVDDEPHIVDLARLYLEREGFRVEAVGNGKDALDRAVSLRPTLVVLDVMLPGLDGFEVCRRLRQQGDTPILMLTARNDDTDKIVGLELGADDYLTKPFNPRELAARVKAILRRYEAGQRPSSVLELGNLRLDLARREARVAGKGVSLRTKEFDLLTAFMRNRGIVLTRDQLLEMVWGYDFLGESRTVDVHITHLRDKIAGSGVAIETVRGVGYRLVVAGQ
ncbi:MAG: response regulator transcription factor [Dehalococcoidales bacterium]|nr:response regulator transcription factor [Dehalococcoidales bacterium]